MNGIFEICVIKWDQKLGGVLECASSEDFKISPATCMNLYQIHRVTSTEPSFGTIRLRLEDGNLFNVISFYTGFGGSTSPNGFTGNYGENTIGIGERVICLFLPDNLRSQNYDEVLAKITSRILLNIENIKQNITLTAKTVRDSGLISKDEELLQYLEDNLDKNLSFSTDNIIASKTLEVEVLHFVVVDKNAIIKNLTINPAINRYVHDRKKIKEVDEQKKQIQDLITKITTLTDKQQMMSSVSDEKSEIIDTLKSDYKTIFGTLTDQIQQLEEEIKGITESTQGLVNDLNSILAEKIDRANKLEEEIKTLKVQR